MVWLLFIAFLLWAGYRLFLGYPRPRGDLRVLAAREAAFLDAAAEAMFPPGSDIPLSGRGADLPGYVDRWLQVVPARQRVLIRLLVLLVEQATLFFPAPRLGFRRFSALGRKQQAAALRAWGSSRLAPRRLVFTALRAILTMGYLGHPVVLRHVGLAPYAIESPVLPADLLYPRVGQHPATIPWTERDLTPPSSGVPLDLDGPLHPDFAEDAS
ncbi:MAG: hypothetical protein VCB42_12270 [Myxococcota bacterium]